MSQKGKSVSSEADALKFVYEPHAAKKIARDFSVAVRTAKFWLSGRFPVARREELAARITARLEERDAMSAAIRRQWGECGSAEVARAEDRRRHVVAGNETDEMDGAVAAHAPKRGRQG